MSATCWTTTCILCTRCVRVCAEVEGARVWDIGSRGIRSMVVADMNRPWGEARGCTSCGKCVQVCPTGAMAEKGQAVEEMVKHDGKVTRLAGRREAINEARSARDGVAGRLLRLPHVAARHGRVIIAIAKRVEVVYGPLVMPGVPKAVDVAVIEGAISSQEDLERVRTIRQRSKLVVALATAR